MRTIAANAESHAASVKYASRASVYAEVMPPCVEMNALVRTWTKGTAVSVSASALQKKYANLESADDVKIWVR